MQLLSASATAFTDEDEEDEDGADDDFDFFPTQKTKVQKDEEEDDDDDDDDDFFPTQKTKVQKISPSMCKRNTYKCDGKSVSVSRFWQTFFTSYADQGHYTMLVLGFEVIFGVMSREI